MDPNRNSTICCQNPNEDSLKAYNDYYETFIAQTFGNYMKSSSYKLGDIFFF